MKKIACETKEGISKVCYVLNVIKPVNGKEYMIYTENENYNNNPDLMVVYISVVRKESYSFYRCCSTGQS